MLATLRQFASPAASMTAAKHEDDHHHECQQAEDPADGALDGDLSRQDPRPISHSRRHRGPRGQEPDDVRGAVHHEHEDNEDAEAIEH